MPYELMYGRAGFLWAALFVNKYIGEETIPSTVTVSSDVFSTLETEQVPNSMQYPRIILTYSLAVEAYMPQFILTRAMACTFRDL